MMQPQMYKGGRRGRDHMVAEITTIFGISAHHH
jgi:hypothetical protein